MKIKHVENNPEPDKNQSNKRIKHKMVSSMKAYGYKYGTIRPDIKT